MMPLMSENKISSNKFFNLSPEEKRYFNLKEKEYKEKTSLYDEILKNKDANDKDIRSQK